MTNPLIHLLIEVARRQLTVEEQTQLREALTKPEHSPLNITRAQRIIDACAAESYYATLVKELDVDTAAQHEAYYQIAVALLTDLRHLCHIYLPEGKFEDALAMSERHAIAEIDSPE